MKQPVFPPTLLGQAGDGEQGRLGWVPPFSNYVPEVDVSGGGQLTSSNWLCTLCLYICPHDDNDSRTNDPTKIMNDNNDAKGSRKILLSGFFSAKGAPPPVPPAKSAKLRAKSDVSNKVKNGQTKKVIQ